ncbi:MAG: hypothetical protein JWO77_1207 [Ilumatobacteraceae bacterium]|nr:hypothetical protein [Ilumatobacteraceae bacterium]
MNLGPTELLVIVLILALLVVPVIVGVVFLARNRGLDDSHQTEAYPTGWQPPPASPPPPPGGPGAAATQDPDIDPGPPPAI